MITDDDLRQIEERIDSPILLVSGTHPAVMQLLDSIGPVIRQMATDRRRLFDEVSRIRTMERQQAEQAEFDRRIMDHFITRHPSQDQPLGFPDVSDDILKHMAEG